MAHTLYTYSKYAGFRVQAESENRLQNYLTVKVIPKVHES